MKFIIKRKQDAFECINELFNSYEFEKDEIDDSILVLKAFIKDIQEDSYIGIEYPYIDKLYRDSYYRYHSSKLKRYNKNCIRLSFFSTPITNEAFFSPAKIKDLENHFLGFLVLRPTLPNIVGRNFFRPDTFIKNGPIYVTTTKSCPTINGVKLEIPGFPHCLQDSEMIVCAETTIWSVVEYFSYRYADYKSILPHEINEILSNKSVERQIPSLGLTAYHMSYVLKKLGFGVRMYSADSYNLANIHKIIQIYVESGIPVVTTIRNSRVAHVMNIIGRTEFNNPEPFTFSVVKKLKSGSVLYDFYEQQTKYLVIDDNLPPYSKISLSAPSKNYTGYPEWEDCKIESAIVPLHNEIYMEADRVQKLVYSFLSNLDEEFPLPSLVVRVFLSSCRSFKDFITRHATVNVEVKQRITDIDMPKFVWLAELGTPEMAREGKAHGIIIIDATEPKKVNIIGSFIENKHLYPVKGEFVVDTVPLDPFKIYHNLQIFPK